MESSRETEVLRKTGTSYREAIAKRSCVMKMWILAVAASLSLSAPALAAGEEQCPAGCAKECKCAPGCEGCKDCPGCQKETGCTDCPKCKGSEGCKACEGCKDGKGCKGCPHCQGRHQAAKECTDCAGCDDCAACSSCRMDKSSCGKGCGHHCAKQAVARPVNGKVELKVTEDGFVPSKVELKKGQPVELVVTRQAERTCATEIVIKELGINQPLPLGKPVVVKLTPTKEGELRFACAMDMIGGTLVVQ